MLKQLEGLALTMKMFCMTSTFLFPQLDKVHKALERSANQLASGQLRSVVPRREIKVSTVDEFQVSLLVI